MVSRKFEVMQKQQTDMEKIITKKHTISKISHEKQTEFLEIKTAAFVKR